MQHKSCFWVMALTALFAWTCTTQCEVYLYLDADDFDASEDAESLSRGIKKFDSAIIRNQLSTGQLYVGGDTIINHNLTVNHDEIIRGNLIISGTAYLNGTALTTGGSSGGGVQITDYKASALSVGTQTASVGGGTLTVAFTNELYDPNNNFSTGTYTVPVDGVYLIDLSLILSKTWAGTEDMNYTVSILIDGVAAANNINAINLPYNAPSANAYAMTRQVSLTAGQEVTVLITNNMPTYDNLVVNANSEFSVHILSANP